VGVRRFLLRVLLPLALTGLLAFIVVRHAQFWWWCEVHLGIHSEAPPYYAFWSGFGSDLGEYLIVWGIFHGLYMHWRFINCHEPWCPRILRHRSAGGIYGYCTRHQPGHEKFGGKMPPREHRVRLHREHLAASKSRGAS
jgi:hypothetical protein